MFKACSSCSLIYQGIIQAIWLSASFRHIGFTWQNSSEVMTLLTTYDWQTCIVTEICFSDASLKSYNFLILSSEKAFFSFIQHKIKEFSVTFPANLVHPWCLKALQLFLLEYPTTIGFQWGHLKNGPYTYRVSEENGRVF